MVSALIGIGSNINPEQHILKASQQLRLHFPAAQFSKVYQSEAVGMQGDDFLNACCLLEHVPAQKELLAWLKSLEDSHGRDRSEGSWKPRTLDLDLLIYADAVVDDDLFRYAHVFGPASELIDLELPAVEAGMLRLVCLRL
ncbi:MAG: 2-amino-4-hydroxy-6-hydroxymethyldihydropteridine diphosphokinase [Mariprofundaceae bacterium]